MGVEGHATMLRPFARGFTRTRQATQAALSPSKSFGQLFVKIKTKIPRSVGELRFIRAVFIVGSDMKILEVFLDWFGSLLLWFEKNGSVVKRAAGREKRRLHFGTVCELAKPKKYIFQGHIAILVFLVFAVSSMTSNAFLFNM